MTIAHANGGDTHQDVLREMRDLGLPLTAQNHAVWRGYRTGSDERLRRTLDVVLSNGRLPDQAMLHQLYTKYCAPQREAAALKAVARQVLATLDLIPDLLGDMKGAAVDYGEILRAATTELAHASDPLRPVVRQLAAQTQEMVVHSNALIDQLTQSADRINELEQFLDEARQEAATDKLTGLANRRAFDTALMAEAASAMNSGHPLAVLLADVDHFKSVNDKWGHDVGDDALRMVADAMRDSVRGRDLVARYGGEEFIIILPDTTQAGAIAVADNIRASVAAGRILVERSNAELRVTISVGVSLYEAGEKMASLVARSDAALYQAKRNGRNRTEILAPGPAAL